MKKLEYSFLLLIILLNCNVFSYSQNIVNDPKGNSAISLNPGFKETKDEKKEESPKIEEIPFNLGIIKFTTSEKKLELNHYSYFTPKKFTDYFIGVNASGEVKNSIASIFSTNNIVTGGEANLRLGFRLFKNQTNWPKLLAGKKTKAEIQNILDYCTRPASDLWLVLNGAFRGSSFKLFSPDSVFSKQINKINFTGTDINIGLNYWNARVLYNTILVGGTIGLKRTNNFDDDLEESTREDTRVIIDTSTNTTRKIVVKQTVYTGVYKETTVYPLNLDLYFVPQKLENIAFLFFSRTDISRTELPKTKLGLGVFFLKKQNAFNPVAGFTIDYSDVFNSNVLDDSKGNFSKVKIALTTRVNIVNNHKRN